MCSTWCNLFNLPIGSSKFEKHPYRYIIDPHLSHFPWDTDFDAVPFTLYYCSEASQATLTAFTRSLQMKMYLKSFILSCWRWSGVERVSREDLYFVWGMLSPSTFTSYSFSLSLCVCEHKPLLAFISKWKEFCLLSILAVSLSLCL